LGGGPEIDRGLSSEILVPGAGIEPARPCSRGILSPLRLPVPPPGLLGILWGIIRRNHVEIKQGTRQTSIVSHTLLSHQYYPIGGIRPASSFSSLLCCNGRPYFLISSETGAEWILVDGPLGIGCADFFGGTPVFSMVQKIGLVVKIIFHKI
jgi:hypothetical protein